jgi:hypothetical protein
MLDPVIFGHALKKALKYQNKTSLLLAKLPL